METIWKYELETTDFQTVSLPVNAEILTIDTQCSTVCIWALVEKTEHKNEEKIIEIFGTGHEMKEANRKYIGTYQLNGGALVFHAFERI